MSPTDERYISAIQTSDRAGLNKIYQQFLPSITRLITQNGGSADDARDIFQDALAILFEKCRQKDFALRSAFSTLLYGICRNLWGNRLQKKSRTEVTLPDDFKYSDGTDLDQVILDAEQNRILWDAFRKISAECQQLMELFFQQKTMAEIAEALQLSSVGYAKKRKFQCKEHLITQVKADPRYREYRPNA